MASPTSTHTYGRGCRFRPVQAPEPPLRLEGIPPIETQFFYSSAIPVDDPLAAATSGVADEKGSLRPFSQRDNLALERAWLGLASEEDRKTHARSGRNRTPSPSLAQANTARLKGIVQQLASKHLAKHKNGGRLPCVVATGATGSNSNLDAGPASCCPELLVDVSAELRREFCAVVRRKQMDLNHGYVVQQVMAHIMREGENSVPLKSDNGIHQKPSSVSYGETGSVMNLQATIPGQTLGVTIRPRQTFPEERLLATSQEGVHNASWRSSRRAGPVKPPSLDDGISGRPFVRVETEDAAGSVSGLVTEKIDDAARSDTSEHDGDSQPVREIPFHPRASAEVPVGISKLHLVSLPVLQMKPIYWSPVNDISIVLRATWFHEDSMTPVDTSVANQLEAGYRELCPWTETWSDEVKSALRVGAEGEEKISHRLWPASKSKKSTSNAMTHEPQIPRDPFCAARCSQGEAAAEGSLEPANSPEDCALPQPEARNYLNHHVIYKDARRAFLLKPSLKPSAYYNRKPVSKIMKGLTVGVPVVRGFDRHAWDQIHSAAGKRAVDVPPAGSQDPSEASPRCLGCLQDEQREQITDLVLVAHGIGQKYSKRVESYSFTLAINAFRKAINVELQRPEVRSVLREGQNGIMVLPVNWRLAVSLDVEDAVDEDMSHAKETFALKDIEPNSIKAVRGIISEVMFDIPFYMSTKHKPKMIAALVAEANRIMRLWRSNHAGQHSPRIHFIGHSLGSAMLLDVLSHQPTAVAPPDPSQSMSTTHFEFNTTNLFFLGSPAGFFLLLERGRLRPRRGRRKPGADPGDTVSDNVVGDVGQFGCLAVDNIYNVLAREDPIAYNLNGTIDPAYSASLRDAYVPSTSTSFMNTMRLIAGLSPASEAPSATRPPNIRLPSQLELEVHDFTREEIAERKAFLLNDNGQVDYILRSGGGPLEIQYLNMLSAHTSYWTNHDLVRMLCHEIGRRPGKEHTLPNMRAAKATNRPFSPFAAKASTSSAGQ